MLVSFSQLKDPINGWMTENIMDQDSQLAQQVRLLSNGKRLQGSSCMSDVVLVQYPASKQDLGKVQGLQA